MLSTHSEEPVANFSIANLSKNAEEYLPDKKARPDLNLQAIDLIFAQIVAFYKAYHLKKLSLIALKLRPGGTKRCRHKKIHLTQRGCCEF